MSPTIRAVPAIEPSQPFFFALRDGGRISATGRPFFVMRTGLRVLRTRSRISEHFALNSEIGISFMMGLPARRAPNQSNSRFGAG